MKSTAELLFIVFKSTIFSLLIFGSVSYLFKFEHVSRLLILFKFLFAAIFLGIEKVILVKFFKYVRKKGFNYRNVLIVGTGKRAKHFYNLIKNHSEWGLRVLGFVDEDASKKGEVIEGSSVIGSFDDIPDILHTNVIDEVVFVVPRSWLVKIEKIIHFCEIEGVKVNVAVDFFELQFARSKQTDLHGFPLLSFESAPDRIWQLLLKRIFDVVISLSALIILSPVFLVVSIMIKLTSPGPVFFRQKRVGLNGRIFTLYKFRTMQADAESKLEGLMSKNEMQGPVFKIENDPRLTSIGKFLRKFSIDEFPQFWNVLEGDMSIVGPRPPIPGEVKKYDSWQRRRLSMRPGLTCLWQASGRNKIVDFDKWVEMDLAYIDEWSLGLDVKLFLKTIPVVLFGVGAK